jgi:RimJ/RimL family protein N-acetyltransferase
MIRIRAIQSKDLKDFVKYVNNLRADKPAAKLATRPYTRAKKWAEFGIKSKKGSFLVVEDRGKIVGHCNLYKKEDRIEVGVTLLKVYRGKNIAKAALKRILAWAKARGTKTVFAGIKKKNIKSLALFQSIGFKIIKEKNKKSYLLEKKL